MLEFAVPEASEEERTGWNKSRTLIIVMATNLEYFEILKQLLKNVRDPNSLNGHPWADSLFVEDAVIGDPGLQHESPGGQLVTALADLFPQMMPSTPPRRGKRLDPRWGEFGLLAALYFTPFNHGTAYPTTLMDAWGRIDEAILYFVYGKPAGELSPEEVEKYRLVGDDLEYGSASTLSDWQRKGLQRFAAIILDQERFLSRTQGRPSPLLGEGQAGVPDVPSAARRSAGRGWCLAGVILAVLLLAVVGLASYKGWRIYQSGLPVLRDVTALREIGRGPRDLAAVRSALPLLGTLQTDLAAFEGEAQPLLWLSPRLGWLPEVGDDLRAAPALLELAHHVLDAALPASQAALPLLDQVEGGSHYDPASLTYLLVQAGPQLQQARSALDEAMTVRQGLDAERLSPRLRGLLVDDLDPLLGQADEALSLALALPDILGAGGDGPKTYLILVENEDELRPTGGFITAFGNLVVHDGQVISMKFEPMDGSQEDWSKPYPAAPWQLREYMNSRVLLMRDSNWFVDYPTTVTWAEYLYAYTHDHSVDGVIAFDQNFLVSLLGAMGPVSVEDGGTALTPANVIEYMRQAKERPEDLPGSLVWQPKAFIGQIAAAVLNGLDSDRPHDWQAIAGVMVQALDEHHLLVQFDDPAVSSLIAARGWDNSVQAGAGDFLMVTDTNVGFNKTNAVVETRLAYDVDLSQADGPQSTLTVFHKNNASPDVPCLQWNTGQLTDERSYPIDRCYWSYLRVYTPAGTALLEATPQAIPGQWMWSGKGVPARVDTLDEELPGIQAFGTLLVVPGGASQTTSFRFDLPAAVVESQPATGSSVYHLKVRKQPGTLAVPLTLRIHLPGRAVLESSSLPGVLQDQSLLVQTDLRTDVELEVVFSMP